MKKVFLSLVVMGMALAGMWTSPAMAMSSESFQPRAVGVTTTLSDKVSGLNTTNFGAGKADARVVNLKDKIAAQAKKSADGIAQLTEEAQKNAFINRIASFGNIAGLRCLSLDCLKSIGPNVIAGFQKAAQKALNNVAAAAKRKAANAIKSYANGLVKKYL